MKSRKSVELNERFNKRWLGYAAAAGAAGVGMLAAGAPASASIIYTPANLSFGPDSGVSFDLGQTGFRLGAQYDIFYEGPLYFRYGLLNVQGSKQGASILGIANFARPLGPGSPISGAKQTWAPNNSVLGKFLATRTVSGSGSARFSGAWSYGGFGFLGLRFLINGEGHYGWAELSASLTFTPLGYSGTLLGYAYETNPNQGLYAGQTTDTPEPGTLGLLALGSLGLGFWRRRKAVASQQ